MTEEVHINKISIRDQIAYFLFLVVLPLVTLSFLLGEFSLKINNTFFAIIILILVLSFFYLSIYYLDSKFNHSSFFFFVNKKRIQFLLAILPITLALLNIGFTLDQKEEEDKHNKKEIVKCIEKYKNKGTKTFSCEIDKEKSNKISSYLVNLSIFNLLLTASFGILLIIHNLF
ncbi:hypothetical protein [Staphylococcus haemolyticus]|uniref:hypothetical protein n=1 Tax=Staphylococcus haemolyticus TaxID=1283 RepID=UPI002901821D|nr:hypothetical protein [Staphylococcus haemolyticus]MDU0442734.1 hypothetical protein [Staphylococcus haemolyticus]MDU0474857.1 hypothetical protein [Staphylococcus haemolyticus]